MQLAFRRPPSAAVALLGFGLLGAVLFPALFASIDPRANPAFWEVTAALVVIVALFSTGLRIDNIVGLRRWRPAIGLLLVTMPLTIAAIAVMGWSMLGLTAAGAFLLGAILAPTDPVLAGAVQVGPPQEVQEHPVRSLLTTEAGLNDGLAFPFVYLELHLAARILSCYGLVRLAECYGFVAAFMAGIVVRRAEAGTPIISGCTAFARLSRTR